MKKAHASIIKAVITTVGVIATAVIGFFSVMMSENRSDDIEKGNSVRIVGESLNDSDIEGTVIVIIEGACGDREIDVVISVGYLSDD